MMIFFPRHVEAPGLQGRHRPQEALFDGGIGQSDKVNPNSELYVRLDFYGHRLDAYTLGAMDGYQHTYSILTEVK